MRYRILCLLLLSLLGPLALPAQTPPAGFTSTLVSGQWNEAVGLTFTASGSHMFVWERPGKVWTVQNGQRRLLLDISEEVGAWHDHGLLGLALHPQFETNGYFYLFYLVDRHYLLNYGTSAYNPATNDYFSATIGRLTRYTATLSGGVYTVNPTSRKVLLGATKTTGVASTERSHVTGGLVFGTDGTLLVATGDGANGADADFGSNPGTYYTQALADGIITSKENVGAFRAQMVDCLNGKILRLDPETGAGVPSNPFYNAADPQAPRSKVWALGFRNPFRMTLRPGTGSTSAAAGNPGTLYIGDVGFFTWEEVDVVSRSGQNLGWPLFEGLEANSSFVAQKRYNYYLPNPQYGVNGCTQQYYYFQDLLTQATPTGTASFLNPCGGQAIAASVPTFVHTRPLIDWKHGTGPARTGTFSGSTAAVANLGAAGSPVAGPQFGGSASVGGVFYPYSDFPAQYRNTYFFGDYSGGWLRNLTVDAGNGPSVVRDFVPSGAIAVGLAVHPTEPGLYYVNFPDEIRKITYNTANQPPLAVASSDKKFGPSPLVVQFTGSASTDPEGQPLSYQWDFGDGTSSTTANPAHTFTAPSAAPVAYAVKLTVTDSQGLTSLASLLISANNTPPQVTITSPLNNALYSISSQTTFTLTATVTDQEQAAGQLSYVWQSYLHHADHEHPEPAQTTPTGSLTTSPLGCGAEPYYYRVVLTVTDAAGLSTSQEIRLNPDCSTAPAYTFYRALNLNGPALTLDGNAWSGTPAANFTTNGLFFANNNVALLPATDAARTGMIRSSAYSLTSLSATLSNVPAGNYRVWAYVWEDNKAETFSLALNGQTVLTNYNSGPAGTWQKVGPFDVSVSTGSLQLTSSGGTCNLSGIEVWQATGTPPPPTNQLPTANAGADVVLTLPVNSTALAGAGADPDGTISSYAWSQLSGPNTAAFSSLSTAAPTVSGLVAGSYVFSLVVKDNAGASSPADQVTVTVNPQTPPPPTGTYTFYRALNLNGPALTLDGNAWSGTPAANFTTNGLFFSNGNVPLLPATDAARTGIIRSSAYSLTSLSATLSNIPTGAYRVWAYVWEDNNAEVFSLALNGQTVQANYNSGPAGTWRKLGPFDMSVSTGSLQLTSSGGTCNLSGLEVWQATGTPPPPTNQLPTATAGPDVVLTLPTSSTTLAGSGTDPDGTISSYAWSQLSGPNTAAFSSTTVAAPTINGLVAGSYTFSLVVKDNAGASSPADQVTVTVNPAGGPTYAFYRAVNLNGGGMTLDGNTWSGTPAANFTTNGLFFANNNVALLPATDAPRTGMIRNSAYSLTGLSATMSNIPAGAYRVWAYVWEDNNAELFSLALNGQTVLTNYNSGPAGTWRKLGPFDVSVSTGSLQLTTSGGTCNLSGIEVWQATGTPAARPLAAASGRVLAPASAIYPNPSPDGRYTLTFPPTIGGLLTYTLLSPVGRVLTHGQLRVAVGSTRTALDMAGLPLSTGFYYVQLTGAHASPIQYKLLR
ncbi:PKD domain-containing protein [Hymenobacter perfusus]|uniref:PKD domain-containing protein n=1 Tax=Hymenobacter perfusus TaxID=1236770 RepID=A0A3R9MS99_9BACT|nr:PKD domain-containing protein [Hymenobacter perfusus]RSK39484.1 PKD domain-containing protein [Hymenobacter perfusus]